jgi:hypothetical protein
MSTMVMNDTNILHLPDEILLTIINKLNMIDVYERFDRLVLDPHYTNHLDLTVKLLRNNNFSVDKKVLDRICKEILPRINKKINKLTIDPHSMECILDVITYPQLYSLSFVNFQAHTLFPYLKGKF